MSDIWTAKPVLAVDFDGTLVEERWPEVGDWQPGAVEVMKYLQQFVRPVVYTARVSDLELDRVTPRHPRDIEREYRKVRLKLDSVGLTGVDIRPKMSADLYVDDKAERYIARSRSWHTLVPKILGRLGFEDEEILFPDFILKGG